MTLGSDLQKAIGMTREMDKKKGWAQLSCQNFLRAVISICDVEKDRRSLDVCRLLLKPHVDDQAPLRLASLKEFYAVKPMIEAAREQAERQNREELRLENVLDFVLRGMPDAVKECLKQSAEQKKSEDSSRNALLEQMQRLRNQQTGGQAAEKKVVATVTDVEQPTKMEDVISLVERVSSLRDTLIKTVIGQEHAVDVCTTGYFNAEFSAMTEEKGSKPRAIFLLAGASGVGKTFLVEQMASLIGLPYLRMDMTEMSSPINMQEFQKAAHFVRHNPKCIILFDEVEKACGDVISQFMQILDAGRYGDADFSEAFLFFTTNAGKQLYEGTDQLDLSGYSRKVILRALGTDVDPRTREPRFPDALCSRFSTGNVVMMNHLSAHHLCFIAQNVIMKKAQAVSNRLNLNCTFDEDVFASLLFAEGGKADGRTVSARAAAFFDSELYELFRLVRSNATQHSLAGIRTVQFAAQLPKAGEITQLYRAEEDARIVVFTDAEELPHSAGCRYYGTDSVERFEELLNEGAVKLVICDIDLGVGNENFLNAEDISSGGRDCFRKLRREHPAMPVYLLHTHLSEEEKLSFMRDGARGFFDKSEFAAAGGQIEEICYQLYQQESMYKLASTNRRVDYRTAQCISEDGTACQIYLRDMTLVTNVDAADQQSILSALRIPDVTFEDVIGAKQAKKELEFFVKFLRDPAVFRKNGVPAPGGVLLHGAPGTGKTMLAKAMAKEAGVTFIAAEGNSFLQKYVGEGPEKVHQLFATARKYAPAIIFVDEIDVIAKERTGDDGSGYKPDDVLTAFLAEMDGFAPNPDKPVFVLAATNYEVRPGTPKSLDGALLRRFDSCILVDLPDRAERLRFLKQRIEGKAYFNISEQQLDSLAGRSVGMSPALLKNVVELARREALRQGAPAVTDDILDHAFETHNSGEEKKWNEDQLNRVAYHEAGHALLAWLAGEKPGYLTIVARGNHGGYMQHADNEGKAIYTRKELLDRIRISLGGRAAEKLIYGPEEGISTGASGDLEQATRTAQHILCSYGMDENFGAATVSIEQGNLPEQVRRRANELLAQQLQLAEEQLAANRNKLEAMVKVLLAESHMSAEEIDRVFSEN